MGQQHVDVQGVAAGCPGVQAGEVEQDGAQECQRDTDGTDHDVLPGGFQRSPGPAVSHEERGGHGRGLDGHPHHTDVVGKDGRCHRGEEDRDQHAVEVGALLVGVSVGELGADVADAGPGGQGAHRADDDQHGDAERVDPEQVRDGEMHSRSEREAEDDGAYQHAEGGQNGHRRRQSSPAEDGREPRRKKWGAYRYQHQEAHQPRSSLSWSRSVPPKVRRMCPVSRPSTSTANITSSDAPSSTMRGTPAVIRNAVAAMPLSSIMKPTAWDRALRRLTMTKTAMRITAKAAGTARVAGEGSSAMIGRVTA